MFTFLFDLPFDHMMPRAVCGVPGVRGVFDCGRTVSVRERFAWTRKENAISHGCCSDCRFRRAALLCALCVFLEFAHKAISEKDTLTNQQRCFARCVFS